MKFGLELGNEMPHRGGQRRDLPNHNRQMHFISRSPTDFALPLEHPVDILSCDVSNRVGIDNSLSKIPIQAMGSMDQNCSVNDKSVENFRHVDLVTDV